MLKGLANFPKEEITLVVSLNMQKIRGRKFQRSTAAKRESIQEDLLHLAPLRHPYILPVVMKKRECQEDPSPGLRDQRRKRSSSQEARILGPIVKMLVQFAFQDSLGASRVNCSTWLCIIKLFSTNSKFWSALLL